MLNILDSLFCESTWTEQYAACVIRKKTLCLAIEIQIKSKWREKKVLRHRKSLKITWQLYKLTAIVTSSIDLYGTFYSMFLFVQLIGWSTKPSTLKVFYSETASIQFCQIAIYSLILTCCIRTLTSNQQDLNECFSQHRFRNTASNAHQINWRRLFTNARSHSLSWRKKCNNSQTFWSQKWTNFRRYNMFVYIHSLINSDDSNLHQIIYWFRNQKRNFRNALKFVN